MVVSNCTRCRRVFRQTYTPMCPDCYHEYVLNFSHVYRYVQDNPAQTLEQIALHCKISLRELRQLFFHGALGTATEHVVCHCLRCQVPMAPIQRRGRFCVSCTEKLETEGRINQQKPEDADGFWGKEGKPGRKSRVLQHPEILPETLSERWTERARKTEAPRVETSSTERQSESYGFKRLS